MAAPRSEAAEPESSEFDLLRDAQGVVDLDAEIPHRAFQFRVAEQKLNRSQIPRLLVYLRGLGAPHRVRPISRAIKPGLLDPSVYDACVLSRRQVRPVMNPAREKVLAGPKLSAGHPVAHRRSGLLGDFT